MPLTLDDVREAQQALQAAGEVASANKILARLGTGSKKTVLKFLRALAGAHQTPSAPAAVVPTPPSAPVPAPVPVVGLPPAPGPAPAPTLLQQAELALRKAIANENKIRLGVQDPAQPITWACLEQCQTATRQAQALVDRLTHSQASLIAGIPATRIAARRAAGELAALEEETRRRLLRARREAQQAQEDLEHMVNDLVGIGGPQVVPADDTVRTAP